MMECYPAEVREANLNACNRKSGDLFLIFTIVRPSIHILFPTNLMKKPGFDSRQRQGYFCLRHSCLRSGSGAHPAFCAEGTGSTAAGTWRWPLTSK